jgi:thymidylate synthase
MKQYLDIVENILTKGEWKENRTGIDTIAIAGAMFEHDMSHGFPLLTTKKLYFKGVKTELEFFIKGLTDKTWLQERGNHIWDEWCNPNSLKKHDIDLSRGYAIEEQIEELISIYQKNNLVTTPQGKEISIRPEFDALLSSLRAKGYFETSPEVFSILDEDTEWHLKKEPDDYLIAQLKKIAQFVERDLGPIYGFQWRHWNAEYEGFDADYSGKGIDQLENIVRTLKKNPNDRRMIVSAWNPAQISQMALPPCHYGFQVTVIKDKLNLLWNQRSVDTMLGLPFNIASYGLLLHLLAKESGFEEGKLIGFLGDVHIYQNHLEGAREQLKREPFNLPTIKTENFSSIFDWKYSDSELEGYQSHPKIEFSIAV